MIGFRLSAVVAVLASAAFAGSVRAEEKDLVETAVAAGKFTTLVKLVKAAGLVETLQSKGPFTVFAPTDEAFAKLPKETVDSLMADKEALRKVLLYHVVPAKVMAADVKAGEVATAEGGKATLKTEGGVTIDGAKVIKTDIVCTNGVIHVIDAVILPKK
jgi:uncharacterized surface protein with fasciclin (FAS1) repeats